MVEINRGVVVGKHYALWSRMPMTYGRCASPVDNRSFVTQFIFMKTICTKTINATITICDLASLYPCVEAYGSQALMAAKGRCSEELKIFASIV
jgi:hypothetical protein